MITSTQSCFLTTPLFHARTKHIELDIHFVLERVVVAKLQIHHVHGPSQIDDALTKSLPTSLFRSLMSKLNVAPPHQLRVCGGVLEITLIKSIRDN